MKRYILFTEEELIDLIRGTEITHSGSGITEPLHFMCKTFFQDDEKNDVTLDDVEINAIYFATEDGAKNAIDHLKGICNWYGCATLADWYDTCGYTKTHYLMSKKGWLKNHLENVQIEQDEFGYKVNLPKTIPIK